MEVEASGTGNADDVMAVAFELGGVPDIAVEAIGAARIRVIACRGSVVDFDPSLSGVRPTNWPAGTTWDSVPGAYIPARETVVVATVDIHGERQVPPFGNKHGSRSLAVHEVLHGYDFSKKHLLSADREFRTAWAADRELLGDDYFKDATHGPGESFAESGARRYGRDQSAANFWPNLRGFWDQHVGRVFLESMGIGSLKQGDNNFEEPVSIGWGEQRADGSVVLYLTAHGEDGMIGHGAVTLQPDDDGYRALSARLGWLGAPEARGRFDVPPFENGK